MPLSDGWEMQGEVLDAARRAGYSVSAPQLGRRRRAGLLPKPRQRSRGPGGGRGTVTVYPPGTGARLVVLCGLESRYRSFADLAWGLWWNGHSLPSLEPVRDRLRRVADETEAVRRAVFDTDGRFSAEAEDALDDAPDRRLNRTLRWSRRRVGRENFDIFLAAMFRVLTGDAAGIDDDEARLLDRGLGLDLARTQSLADVGPWLPGDIRDDIAGIAATVDGFAVVAALPESDLCRARDDTVALARLMADIGSVLQPTSGRFAFGLAHMGTMLVDMLSTPDDQARTLAMLAALRGRGLGPGLETILQSAPAAQEGAEAYRMLLALRSRIPAVAEVVSDKRFSDALRNGDLAAALRDDIAGLRSSYADEIDRALLENGAQLERRGTTNKVPDHD